MAVERAAQIMQQRLLVQASELHREASQLVLQGKIEEAERLNERINRLLSGAKLVPSYTGEYLERLRSIGVEQPQSLEEQVKISLGRVERSTEPTTPPTGPVGIVRTPSIATEPGKVEDREKREVIPETPRRGRPPKTEKIGEPLRLPDGQEMDNLPKPEYAILKTLLEAKEEKPTHPDLVKQACPEEQDQQKAVEKTNVYLARLRKRLSERKWRIENATSFRDRIKGIPSRYGLASDNDNRKMEERGKAIDEVESQTTSTIIEQLNEPTMERTTQLFTPQELCLLAKAIDRMPKEELAKLGIRLPDPDREEVRAIPGKIWPREYVDEDYQQIKENLKRKLSYFLRHKDEVYLQTENQDALFLLSLLNDLTQEEQLSQLLA